MASKIKWDDKYLIGIKSIDDQHRKLIQLIIDIWEAVEVGKARAIILEVIQSLLSYTRDHFGDEEKYMLQFDYPEYYEHKKDHDRFVEEVMKITIGYADGKAVPSIKILQFLAQWLVDHIMVRDKHFGEYLRQIGAPISKK